MTSIVVSADKKVVGFGTQDVCCRFHPSASPGIRLYAVKEFARKQLQAWACLPSPEVDSRFDEQQLRLRQLVAVGSGLRRRLYLVSVSVGRTRRGKTGGLSMQCRRLRRQQ
jgi:hypothetical protein